MCMCISALRCSFIVFCWQQFLFTFVRIDANRKWMCVSVNFRCGPTLCFVNGSEKSLVNPPCCTYTLYDGLMCLFHFNSWFAMVLGFVRFDGTCFHCPDEFCYILFFFFFSRQNWTCAHQHISCTKNISIFSILCTRPHLYSARISNTNVIRRCQNHLLHWMDGRKVECSSTPKCACVRWDFHFATYSLHRLTHIEFVHFLFIRLANHVCQPMKQERRWIF